MSCRFTNLPQITLWGHAICFYQEMFLGVSQWNSGTPINELSFNILYTDPTTRNQSQALGGYFLVSLIAWPVKLFLMFCLGNPVKHQENWEKERLLQRFTPDGWEAPEGRGSLLKVGIVPEGGASLLMWRMAPEGGGPRQDKQPELIGLYWSLHSDSPIYLWWDAGLELFIFIYSYDFKIKYVHKTPSQWGGILESISSALPHPAPSEIIVGL